jgi:hypothetical protein
MLSVYIIYYLENALSVADFILSLKTEIILSNHHVKKYNDADIIITFSQKCKVIQRDDKGGYISLHCWGSQTRSFD